MNSNLLRRRILGAFVLVCLAVILWPLIFSDVPVPFVDTRTQIPASGTFSEYQVPEPRVPENIAAVEPRHKVVEDELPAGDEQPGTSVGQSKPELDARGLPIAWVIQVGSFADASNGLALKERLQEKGYKAYTETATTNSGKTTRVFVGPLVSKSRSLAEKKKIDEAFQLKSKVVRYVP